MSRFMLDRRTSVPPGYADRGCVLVSYRLPLLKHCFVLCADSIEASGQGRQLELMSFFLTEAHHLAQEAVGDPQAFMLIHSGQSVRKRATWHLHVFVVRTRWQKAWVYTVLGVKNTVLAGYSALRPKRIHSPAPSAARPDSCRPPPS